MPLLATRSCSQLYLPQLVSHGPEGFVSKDRYSSSPHPPCVEVEGLPLLICIEELFKVPVGVEHAPSQAVGVLAFLSASPLRSTRSWVSCEHPNCMAWQ